jgi:hypothetical protein
VIAEALADRPGQVTLLNRLAVDLANDLEFVRAMEHTEAALVLADETGKEAVVATALDGRKLVAAYLGDFAVLNATVATLEGILRRHNDLWTLSFTLAESAVEAAARTAGDAVGLIEEALANKRRIADRKGQLPRGHAGLGPPQPRRLFDAPTPATMPSPWLSTSTTRVDAWAGNNLGATLLELRCPEQATEPLALAGCRGRPGFEPTAAQLRTSRLASWLVGDILGRSLLGRAENSSQAPLPSTQSAAARADATTPWPARTSPGASPPGRSRCLPTCRRGRGRRGARPWPSVSSSSRAVRGRLTSSSRGSADPHCGHAHIARTCARSPHSAAQISRAWTTNELVDPHVTDALEIITRIADAIRTPDSSERFVAMATSDLRARPSP